MVTLSDDTVNWITTLFFEFTEEELDKKKAISYRQIFTLYEEIALRRKFVEKTIHRVSLN